MFNYLMAMKLDADQKVQEKHKNKKLKHEYKVNLNVLFGLIKLDMPDLLSDNPQEKKDAIKRILNTAQSNLVEKIEKITEILIELSKIHQINSHQHKKEENKKIIISKIS